MVKYTDGEIEKMARTARKGAIGERPTRVTKTVIKLMQTMGNWYVWRILDVGAGYGYQARHMACALGGSATVVQACDLNMPRLMQNQDNLPSNLILSGSPHAPVEAAPRTLVAMSNVINVQPSVEKATLLLEEYGDYAGIIFNIPKSPNYIGVDAYDLLNRLDGDTPWHVSSDREIAIVNCNRILNANLEEVLS